jgi:endonuclease YncB( thermonuclease family)
MCADLETKGARDKRCVIVKKGTNEPMVLSNHKLLKQHIEALEYERKCVVAADANRRAADEAERFLHELIRLTDYDSPELHARCPRELVPCATSNYGRLCARGTIDDKPLAEYMIERKLAVTYICTPTRGHCPIKVDWCHSN